LSRPISSTIPRFQDVKEGETEAAKGREEEQRVFDSLGDAIQEVIRVGDLSESEMAEAKEALENWQKLSRDEQMAMQQQARGFRSITNNFEKVQMPKERNSFWFKGETDPLMMLSEDIDDEFQEDDILSMAHGKLEEHREHREYARLSVWEMPLLSSKFCDREPKLSTGELT
jgi:small subunit ribosomal protein S35